MEKYVEEYEYPLYINNSLIINKLKTISEKIYCKISDINKCYYCRLRISSSGFYVNILEKILYNKKNRDIAHLSIHFSRTGNSIMHWKDNKNNSYDIKFNIIFNKDIVENMILSYSKNYNFNSSLNKQIMKKLTDSIFSIITNKYNNKYLFYKKQRSNSIISENNFNNANTYTDANTNANTYTNNILNNILNNHILNTSYKIKKIEIMKGDETTTSYLKCKSNITPHFCKKNPQSGGEQNPYVVYLSINEIKDYNKIIYKNNNLKKNNIDKNNIKSLELLFTIVNSFNESYNEILYETINKEIENILKTNNILKINNNIKEHEIINVY